MQLVSGPRQACIHGSFGRRVWGGGGEGGVEGVCVKKGKFLHSQYYGTVTRYCGGIGDGGKAGGGGGGEGGLLRKGKVSSQLKCRYHSTIAGSCICMCVRGWGWERGGGIVCVRACVCVCVFACVRACVRACVS